MSYLIIFLIPLYLSLSLSLFVFIFVGLPSFEREAFFFEVLRELEVLNPSTDYRTNLMNSHASMNAAHLKVMFRPNPNPNPEPWTLTLTLNPNPKP
jgi:hypothetical protein